MFFNGLCYGQINMFFAARVSAGERGKDKLFFHRKRYEKMPLLLNSIVYQTSLCVLLIEQDPLSLGSFSLT